MISSDSAAGDNGTLAVLGSSLVGVASNTSYRMIVGPVPGLISTAPEPVVADFDRDGDVDQDDYDHFETCASGPEVPYMGGCGDTDFDGDLDTDHEDFAVFQRCYSGENSAARPDCAD